MSKTKTTNRIPGAGLPVRPGFVKMAIVFPEKLFQDIRDKAVRERTTISEVVADWAKCGQLCLEENEREENHGDSFD